MMLKLLLMIGVLIGYVLVMKRNRDLIKSLDNTIHKKIARLAFTVLGALFLFAWLMLFCSIMRNVA